MHRFRRNRNLKATISAGRATLFDLILATMGGLSAGARSAIAAAHLTFSLSASDVLAGADIGTTSWSARLAVPSAEGQFEVLVRKTATPVLAPHCKSAFLVVRMPASIGDGADTRRALAEKRIVYENIIAARRDRRSIRFEIFAGPYGHTLANGRVELTGCNLFFAEPKIPKP